MRKGLFSSCLAIGLLSCIQPTSAQEQLRLLQETFTKRDTAILNPILADNFAIAGQTGKNAAFCLQQFVQRYPAKQLNAIESQSKDNNKIAVLFEDEKDNRDTAYIQLNEAGKIRYISLFDKLYGMQRKEKANLRATIPFENQHGSIILELKINAYEKPLRMLFDTGADGMAVSQELADAIGLQVTRENKASVVGGSQQIKVSDNNTIKIQALELKDMGIAIFPNRNDDYSDGILGNTLFRRYITEIDYDNNLLRLYDFGPLDHPKDAKVIDFTFPSGVAHFKGNLQVANEGNNEGEFIFDTGAAYSLICFRPFVKQHKLLVSGFKPESQGSTVSLGMASPTFTGYSKSFQLTGLPALENMLVTLMGGNNTNKNWDPGADGSIGVRLLSRYNIRINLAENEISLQPNALSKLPEDFMLKEQLIGWNNQGQLTLLSSIDMAAIAYKGKVIDSINGKKAAELSKNPKLIPTLIEQAKTEKLEIKFNDNQAISI